MTKLSKTQRISIIILLILIVITMAVFSAVQMLKNTREFMNLFTFVFSNLALILFSFTIIALALIAFFWSLTNSDQKKSKAYNINDLLVKTGSLIFENSNFNAIINQLTELIVFVSGHSSVSLLEWDTKKEKFITLASKNLPRERANSFFMTIKAETLFCATSAAPEFPIFEIDNIPDFYSIEDPSDKNRHLVLIPFKSQGQLIGSAVLHDVYDPSLISKENQKILSLVSTITAGYLHNLRLKEDFENASVFDHITGKYKYSFFQAFLEQEIERADRYETSATLMAIDVTSPDNLFIEPNESFYKKSSDKIFSVLRSIDLLFMHPENNSFIIILSQTDNSTSLDVAARVIQKFTKSLDEKTGEISEDTPLKVSIGLSTYPLDATLEANLVDNVFTCLDKARAAEESKIVNYCDIY